MSGILAAGFIGFLAFGNTAVAEQVSRQQILDALTAQPKVAGFADRLRLTRSLTLDDRDYDRRQPQVAAGDRPRSQFRLQLRGDHRRRNPSCDELGEALSDPQLRDATISINGHTDGVGGDAFNKKLSERRAAMIKRYLVDNFQLSPSHLRTVGYGKSRPKNKSDLNASENRRVEVVNLAPQAHAQR